MHLISFKLVAAVVFALLLATGLYNTFKPMPAGLSRSSPIRPLYDARLIPDVSWRSPAGEHVQSQGIFREVFDLIAQAHGKRIVVDFEFNDLNSDFCAKRSLRPSASQNQLFRVSVRPSVRPCVRCPFGK